MGVGSKVRLFTANMQATRHLDGKVGQIVKLAGTYTLPNDITHAEQRINTWEVDVGGEVTWVDEHLLTVV